MYFSEIQQTSFSSRSKLLVCFMQKGCGGGWQWDETHRGKGLCEGLLQSLRRYTVKRQSWCGIDFQINPLTPVSDQEIISPYNFNTTSNRQVRRNISTRGDQLIQHKVLRTNFIRIVWQTVRRITNKILGMLIILIDY